MQIKPILLLFAVSLSACAQTPDGARAVEPAAATSPAGVLAAPAPPARVTRLTPQLMYQYLLGEIAKQRGELRLSADAFTDLAQRTRDPRVARRATEIALHARQGGLALRNARLWQELEPDSPHPHHALATLLAGAGRLSEARPHLERWLQAGPPERLFLQLHALLARVPDRPAVASLVTELAAGHPNLPEAQFAVAQAAWQARQAEPALHALGRALQLRPAWEQAALFKAQVLQQTRGGDAALELLTGFVQAHPTAREARLALARQLAHAGRMDEARQSFTAMMQEAPQDPIPHFALALLAMHANDLDAARAGLLRALELGHPEPAVVQFSLGQVAEAASRFDEAITHYRAVTGAQRFDAALRVAVSQHKAGRHAEARAELAGITPANDAQAVRLAQVEAEMLRELRQFEAAFDILERALARQPDHLELLYDRAMVAERLGRLDVMETHLRRMIELQPDHAHAHNALGYTLADRTDRLDEAYQLLRTAIRLAPDDPYIQDSVGWVLYRLNRPQEALEYLRRAFATRPDPEIAAHLGEVLWVLGERDEARRIWQDSIRAHPDNEVLRETITRLAP